MAYFIVLIRTIIFYIIITFIYRFMGKREVGQLGMVDLTVSILIERIVSFYLFFQFYY